MCDLCTCVDLKLCHILSCLSAIVFRPVSDQCPRHSGPWLTLYTLPVKVREPNIAEFTMDTSDALQPNSPFRLFVYVFETQLLNINRGTVLRRPEEVSMFCWTRAPSMALHVRSNPEFTPQMNYWNFRIISSCPSCFMWPRSL